VDAPRTSVRMSKVPQIFSSYMVLMSELIEVEPYEQHVWRDDIMEEYYSIMKKYMWEIVPRS
jgi:hypothetical protein